MTLDVFFALLLLALMVSYLGYTVYIVKFLVPKVDYELNGGKFEHDSWLAQALRANEYTSYSMLPSRAKKAGVYEKFYALSPWVRWHFNIWMGLAALMILVLFIVNTFFNTHRE